MSTLWNSLIRPAAFRLDAERAHEIGIKALEMGAAGPFYREAVSNETERFGLRFANPLGIAAGFDKNGVVVDQLASLGFGFVEVGTVTYHPQPGNPKPRLFRLPADQALINRLGFNNDGAEVVAKRLAKLKRNCVVGVNIGRNKDVLNEDAVENYLACFDVIHPVADYIAVNISSPNTPNLRELQKADSLGELLSALQARNRVLSTGFSRQTEPPEGGTHSARKSLLVKIAPDLNEGEIEAVVDTCIGQNIYGIIATNTTISRGGLSTNDVARFGDGGLSGKPLLERSNEVISAVYRYSKGKLPIVGVGGIFTAEGAFDKIAAGASLLQAYTGFVYGGPAFAHDVNEGLAAILKDKGFKTLDEAVGSALG
jgi:dihydroorotate dehydrogenase